MPRQRMIKPSFFTDGRVLSCEPLARLLFEGLWCDADREGRLDDRPVDLKVRWLPVDNCDVDALLDQLAFQGLIQRYAVQGSRFICIPNFLKHQKPHVREPPSVIPPPPAPGQAGADTLSRMVSAPTVHSAGQVPEPSPSPPSTDLDLDQHLPSTYLAPTQHLPSREESESESESESLKSGAAKAPPRMRASRASPSEQTAPKPRKLTANQQAEAWAREQRAQKTDSEWQLAKGERERLAILLGQEGGKRFRAGWSYYLGTDWGRTREPPFNLGAFLNRSAAFIAAGEKRDKAEPTRPPPAGVDLYPDIDPAA